MGTGAAAGSITRDELLAQIASRVRHVTSIAGERLVIFELNGFLNFFPPLRATAFLAALVQTGYTIYLIAVTHLIVGVLLLANRFVPLPIALFAPFIVNSIAFHTVLERSGLPMAIGFLALELYLAWKYREAYRPMLTARASVA
jgi:hypothetical protein